MLSGRKNKKQQLVGGEGLKSEVIEQNRVKKAKRIFYSDAKKIRGIKTKYKVLRILGPKK